MPHTLGWYFPPHLELAGVSPLCPTHSAGIFSQLGTSCCKPTVPHTLGWYFPLHLELAGVSPLCPTHSAGISSLPGSLLVFIYRVCVCVSVCVVPCVLDSMDAHRCGRFHAKLFAENAVRNGRGYHVCAKSVHGLSGTIRSPAEHTSVHC